MEDRVNLALKLSLCAAAPDEDVALCAAQALPHEEGAAGAAPDWVHLLPAGPAISTHDGRAYRMDDPGQVVAASLEASRDRGAVIDENHATDLAAPNGQPAPARGWLTSFEARADGVWGKVCWNAAGRALMEEHAYRGISPVILHDKKNRVLAVLRASLVNKPNLKGLKALNQESDMDLLKKLVAALKLETTTSEDALVAAVTALNAEAGAAKTALNAELAPIARAAGLQEDATAEAIAGAVAGLKSAPAGGKTIEALQAELTSVAGELNKLRQDTARDKAVSFVDAAIKAGRVGVKPLRDDYVAMHMEDPARAEKLISGMPILNGTTIVPAGDRPGDGVLALNAEEKAVIKQLGLDPKAFVAARDGTAETAA